MHTERPTTAQARAAVIEEIAAPGRALAHRVLEASNAGDTDEAMAEARTNRDTTPRCLLGHGTRRLAPELRTVAVNDDGDVEVSYAGEAHALPDRLARVLDIGPLGEFTERKKIRYEGEEYEITSLAGLNDTVPMTIREMGAWLENNWNTLASYRDVKTGRFARGHNKHGQTSG